MADQSIPSAEWSEHRPRPWRFPASAVVVFLAASLLGCGDSESPTEPSPMTAVTIEAASPSSGALVIPATYPFHDIGGVVLPKDSALISVRAALSLANASSFGQLSIYLNSNASGSEYCGQNSPDSPTWRNLPAGWTTTYTVTGFQVYRAPCTVTGVRVILHSRDDPSLGAPPRPEQIIAEATLPVSYQITVQR